MKAQQFIPEDRRKFEAELPNDLWQSDVLHGPLVETGNKKRKSYLIAFIDDYSRLVPYGEFYLGEGLAFFLQALEQALATRGLPRKLYVDNGSAFRSHHLEQITASLGIALIHARPYKPQGKGKIERYFRTVRSDFLSGFQRSHLGRFKSGLRSLAPGSLSSTEAQRHRPDPFPAVHRSSGMPAIRPRLTCGTSFAKPPGDGSPRTAPSV